MFDNQQVREMVQPISNKFLTTSAARYSKTISSLGVIRSRIENVKTYWDQDKTHARGWLKLARKKINEAMDTIDSTRVARQSSSSDSE